jgi:hypothetical protein
VFNHSNEQKIYIKGSPDGRKMAVSFDDTSEVRIYDTKSW